MTVTIGVAKPGQGTGKVVSMFYSEERGKFIVTVSHKVGLMRSATPVELDPGLAAVTILTKVIPGFLADQEAKLLFELAKAAGGPIVEIGSFMGKSTVCLGWGSRLGNKVPVYAIDPHRGSPEHEKWLRGSLGTYPTFAMNMEHAGLESHVIPKRMTSEYAVKGFEDNSVALVFIDGNHNQSSKDFDLWSPKVKSGGVIALHDSTGSWPMVEETVKTRLEDSEDWTIEEVVVTITVGRKT